MFRFTPFFRRSNAHMRRFGGNKKQAGASPPYLPPGNSRIEQKDRITE
jgi:hypothetical protein